MKESWFYNSKPGNASLTGRPPRIKDLGEHSIGTFVREFVQNSLDARISIEKAVDICFTVEEWGKNEIADFFKLIGDDYKKLYSQSYEQAASDVKPKMERGYRLLSGKSNKTFGLVVEEYNTTGLTGSVEGIDDKSNFSSLVRKTDDNEAKKELSNSGGTWGKGSSIFVYSSEIWMWFCYTYLFKKQREENNIEHTTRFIGRSIFSPFYSKETGTGYLGDNWFCIEKTDAFPYINDDANGYAEIFGLNKRTIPGTTFFIPFFNTFLDEPSLKDVVEEFRKQVLQNWFIPIYDGNLTVTVKTGSEEVVIDKGYLQNVYQLKFKLELLEWYYDGCPPDDRFIRETYHTEIPALKREYTSAKNSFAAKKQTVRIDLVIRKIDEDEDFDNSWETQNKVMLTRNNGMLVDMHEPMKNLRENNNVRTESILFAGLLSLSETNQERKKHADLFLAYSENPAHNKWCKSPKDYNSCFLEFFEGRPAPEGYISKIFNEIYSSFKKLFDDDKKIENSKDICSVFKKIARLNLAGGNKSTKSLFSMRTPHDVSNPTIDSTGSFYYKYLIKSHADQNIDISFKSMLNSLEGETDRDFSLLGVQDFEVLKIFDESEDLLSEGLNPTIRLAPRDEITIKIKTCKIIGVKAFKNLEPIIKSTAKYTTNE